MVTNAKFNMFPAGKLPFVAQVWLGTQELYMRTGIAHEYSPTKYDNTAPTNVDHRIHMY